MPRALRQVARDTREESDCKRRVGKLDDGKARRPLPSQYSPHWRAQAERPQQRLRLFSPACSCSVIVSRLLVWLRTTFRVAPLLPIRGMAGLGSLHGAGDSSGYLLTMVRFLYIHGEYAKRGGGS